MLDGFTALAFSFCAALTLDGGQDVVALGYVSQGECEVHMVVGDTQGEAAVIDGHEISVKMLEHGAEISVDDLRFVLIKTEGI